MISIKAREWLAPAEQQGWACAVCGLRMADRRECDGVCCRHRDHCACELGGDVKQPCRDETCKSHRALSRALRPNLHGIGSPDPHASTLRVEGEPDRAAHLACVLNGDVRRGYIPAESLF